LIALLNEKSYDDITVEEITTRADISRPTFYLHYKDKDDLLIDHLNGIADETVSELLQVPLDAWRMQEAVSGPDVPPVRPLLMAFQHVAEYADLYRLVLQNEGGPQLSERLNLIIRCAVDEFVRAKLDSGEMQFSLSLPVALLANYFSGAFLGCTSWWLEEGLSLSPEEMTRHFQQLFFPGLRRLLGLKEAYSS
jgi:AcrR family transcriptional regulator